MPTIGFYFRGLTQTEVNALRTRLNELAARHGYLALRGATKARGEGNLAAMLVAIDAGELTVVRPQSTHRIHGKSSKTDVL